MSCLLLQVNAVAHGRFSGSVELANFPSFEGEVPKAQLLELPDSYGLTKPGSVKAMEWSSDGYVLAVGWDNGWAVWSVGGRCLSWSFSSESVDTSRCLCLLHSHNCEPDRLGFRMHLCSAFRIWYVWKNQSTR